MNVHMYFKLNITQSAKIKVYIKIFLIRFHKHKKSKNKWI